MKKWTTPMAMEECFTANVDVAVTTCYKIACDTNAATEVEKQKYAHSWLKVRPHHYSWTCGDENHQTIQVDSANGNEVKKMTTVNGGVVGQWDSDCIFYDSTYLTQIDAKDVDITRTIYWVTTGEAGLQYHHQGTIGAIASNKSMS